MSKVRLTRQTYYDKVYGCWLGNNAGGTLGDPLERIFGQEEMFDVWWSPKLVEVVFQTTTLRFNWSGFKSSEIKVFTLLHVI